MCEENRCDHCKSAILNVGCGKLSTQPLDKESMAKLKKVIQQGFEKIENKVTLKIAENSRPHLATAISQKFREERERGF